MIINKEQLAALAKKNGFKVKVDVEDAEDFNLWLFLLKEWLSDKHNIHALPQFYLTAGFGTEKETFGCSLYYKKGKKWTTCVVKGAKNSASVDIASMAGLKAGLKLLD